MGIVEKLRLRELAARFKMATGRQTGDRRLVAEGRTDAAEARLLRTKAQISDMAREFRRGSR